MKFIPAILFLLLFSSCSREAGLKNNLEYVLLKYEKGSYERDLAGIKYLAFSGKDLEFSLEIARNLIDNSRFTEARYGLERLEKIHGANSAIMLMKAVCFRNEYRLEDAENEITKAISLFPHDQQLEAERLNIIADLQSWEEIKVADEKVRKQGKNVRVLFERGKILLESGYYEEAQYDFREVMKRDSLVNEIYSLNAMALVLSHEYQKADTLIDRWKTLAGNELPENLSEDIRMLADYRKKEAGRASLDDYLGYSRLLVKYKDYQEAENIIDQSLQYFPGEIKLLYSSMLIRLESGKKEEAGKLYRELLEKGMPGDERLEKLLK